MTSAITKSTKSRPLSLGNGTVPLWVSINFILGVAGALWIGWPWLVAIGIAPLLIAMSPCLLMCAALCGAKLCRPTVTTGKSTIPEGDKSRTVGETDR